ncbi:MAG: zf-HC2 domain-containing protein [Candidatus Marinimicrobia bacterium]|nr:zf-HC2 domain-containing protein [Candidatus Neomarinimicrobiota bacterium]
MKHETKFEEMLMLFHFDELSEMETKIFQKHLKECSKCQHELKELQQMDNVLASEPEEMPSVELVEKANAIIMKKLNSEDEEPTLEGFKSFFSELADSFAQLFAQPKFQLSGMAATLVVGILIGKVWLSSGLKNNPEMMIHLLSNNTELSAEQYQQFQNSLASSMLKSGNVEIEDFQMNENTAADGIMSVSYKLKNNFEARGGLDDPLVRKSLMYAARQDENPSTRMRAINLLSGIGVHGQIEETFSAVILYDGDESIRLKTADLLSTQSLSEKTLESFKSVALKDTCSEMRLKAIDVLKEHNAENLETVLAVMATRDRDAKVKEYAREALNTLNQTNN